jgi:hypothetical protein
VKGLHVNIDLTGELMATAAGNMPTVLYTVEFRGQECKLKEALPVAAAPLGLANDLRAVLVDDITAEAETLIDAVENCSVAMH